MRIRVVMAMMIGVVVTGCGGTSTSSPLPVPETQRADMLATAQSNSSPPPTESTSASATLVPTPTEFPSYLIVDRRPDLMIYTTNNHICSVSQGADPVFVVEWSGTRIYPPSPNHEFIVYTRYHVTKHGDVEVKWEELWIARIDGSDARMLLDLEDFSPIDSQLNFQTGPYRVGFVNLQWISGSRQIVFNTMHRKDIPDYELDMNKYHNDLHNVDANTGELQMLLGPGNGASSFRVSPDGHTIAFITRGAFEIVQGDVFLKIVKPDSISLIHSDGTGWQQNMVTYDGAVIPVSNGWVYYDPLLMWSPDSSGVHIAIFPTNPLQAGGNAEITGWFLPIDEAARSTYHLEHLNYLGTTVSNTFPSPDGLYVAFHAEYENRIGLHIINTETFQDKVYYENEWGRFSRWEDDSTHFIVQTDFDHINKKAIYARIDVGSSTVESVEEKPAPDLKDCVP